MPRRTHFDVRAQALRQVGKLVHEGDARRQHGIGGILGQFGRAHVHDDHALVAALERRVQVAHDLGGALVVAAYHDAVGAHEILDRGAFLEEFRVGHHAVVDVGAALFQLLGNGGAHFVGRAHGNGGLVHHHA